MLPLVEKLRALGLRGSEKNTARSFALRGRRRAGQPPAPAQRAPEAARGEQSQHAETERGPARPDRLGHLRRLQLTFGDFLFRSRSFACRRGWNLRGGCHRRGYHRGGFGLAAMRTEHQSEEESGRKAELPPRQAPAPRGCAARRDPRLSAGSHRPFELRPFQPGVAHALEVGSLLPRLDDDRPQQRLEAPARVVRGEVGLAGEDFPQP